MANNSVDTLVYFTEDSFMTFEDFKNNVVLPRLGMIDKITLKNGKTINIDEFINTIVRTQINNYQGDFTLLLEELTTFFDKELEITPIEQEIEVPKLKKDIIVFKEEDFANDDELSVDEVKSIMALEDKKTVNPVVEAKYKRYIQEGDNLYDLVVNSPTRLDYEENRIYSFYESAKEVIEKNKIEFDEEEYDKLLNLIETKINKTIKLFNSKKR